MRIAFVSTFDSFVRSSRILAHALIPYGAEVTHIVTSVRVDQISDAQVLAILGSPPDHKLDLAGTMGLLEQGHWDWVILSAENATCRRFFEMFRARRFQGHRPLVATIYPGILFRHHYDGFSARMPADLVILNSAKDQRMFRELRQAYGTADDNSFNLGPVTVLGSSGFTFETNRPLVLFFDQPSVPCTREEKLYLFGQLARLAKEHPHLDFRVKLRVGPRDSTLHRGGQETLAYLNEFNRRRNPGGPPLRLIDGPPRDLIARSRLALSVSSTALVEALACGCPAVSISDFGIDEDYGGAYFAGSGICSTLEEIHPEKPPQPNPAWMEDNVGNPDQQISGLAALLEAMSRAHAIAGTSCGVIHPYFGSQSFYQTAAGVFGKDSAITRRYRRRSAMSAAAFLFNFACRQLRQLSDLPGKLFAAAHSRK